jgi:ribose/xylose/arabinose/galactoside ABC-type transport system permease subunit
MSHDAVHTAACSRAGWAERIARVLRPWLGLALVCGGFSLHPRFLHTFWTQDYLPNILQQAATNIVVAVGMTFVIMTGGIDLSVGSVMALCGVALGLATTSSPPAFIAFVAGAPIAVLAATLITRGAPLRSGRAGAGMMVGIAGTVVLGLVIQRLCGSGAGLLIGLMVALGVGIASGLANGLVVTRGNVPPFVATLGMLTAARGLTIYATGGNSVSGLPAELGVVGQGAPLILVALMCTIIGSLLLTRTRLGRYITAIGGNEEAARLSGVNVGLNKTIAYVISGLTAAIAAILLTAKFRLADTGAGTNAELNAIAAVVIGGASLSGGQASVPGSLVGALTIAVLNAGLVLVGIPDTLQGVIIGGVIIITVLVDQLQRRGRS